MKELVPNGGIPRNVLFAMAVIGGLTVANLYYNQPLLEAICQSIGITELQANFITFITQIGYASGLILIVPLADKVSRRKIITVNMSVAVVCCLALVPEATNRSNTIFMSHLFAGGSLGTLCAGVAWGYGGWDAVCLVGFSFSVAVAMVNIFKGKKVKK